MRWWSCALLLLAGCLPVDPELNWGADALPIGDAPPDVVGLAGWQPPAAEAKEWAATCPEFCLTKEGAPVWQDNTKADVRHWDQVKALNGGQVTPPGPQEIGDCTSWGAKHAIQNTVAAQSIRGPPVDFAPVFAPYLYGAGRVLVAKGLFKRGDGCDGASVARAAVEHGVLLETQPGVPKYSGSLARQWGNSGPPAQFVDLAKPFRIKYVARVRTVDQCRDAIVNGYGVTIASSWGTSNKAMRVQDGRVVARRSGSWAHQMCVDAYDGSAPSGRIYFHIQNSWGENAHPEPVDDSPPGGFWVEANELATILAAEDSWAFSGSEGFEARLDLGRIRPRGPPR